MRTSYWPQKQYIYSQHDIKSTHIFNWLCSKSSGVYLWGIMRQTVIFALKGKFITTTRHSYILWMSTVLFTPTIKCAKSNIHFCSCTLHFIHPRRSSTEPKLWNRNYCRRTTGNETFEKHWWTYFGQCVLCFVRILVRFLFLLFWTILPNTSVGGRFRYM
jgi:hypothetical protein